MPANDRRFSSVTVSIARRFPRLAVVVGSVIVGLPGAVQAQMVNQVTPIGAASGSVAARADSIAGQGDTTQALALLEDAVRRNPRDAVSWYYLGSLLWNQTGVGMRPGRYKDQKLVRRVAAADSSLRLAAQYAPDSARYLLTLAAFNLRSGYASVMASARGQFDDALKAATTTRDTRLLAQAADAIGDAAWRDYEGTANRALTTDNQRIQLTNNNAFQRKDALAYVQSFARRIEPPTGGAAYNRALEYFRMAIEADSSNLRYSRHLFMALAERKDWTGLRDVAKRRAVQFPLDYQSRLALGLAYHRLEKYPEARAAFDSATSMMDEGEAAYYTRFTRILRPRPSADKQNAGGDSLSYAKLPPEQKRGLEAMYWLMNDPLALTSENEYRLEFLARVVYAEFRFSSDDLGIRGAETDRGDTYIRYGPPDYEVATVGSSFIQGLAQDNGITITWAYNQGLTFFFDLSRAFGAARHAVADRDFVEKARDAVPVSFANMPTSRLIDSIPVRVARFRGTGDTTDLVLAARVSLDSLTRGATLAEVPVDFDFRVFDQFVRVQGVESSQARFAADSTNAYARRTYTRKLGPGINVVRLEAFQADTRRAARAMVRLDPVVTRGFGMSDVLLGSKPSARGNAAPTRWRDVEITPTEGSITRGASLGLLWEVYDLSAKDGTGRYRVAIAVERTERGGPLGFAVRAMDGLGRAVGRTQASRDKFTITFDRSAPAAPTLVEFLSLDMSDAPAGRYTLRVEISDLGSGKKVFRDTEFSLR